MTIGLTYNDDLSRVQIALSDRPNGAVQIERSTNQLFWLTVRGGVALPISGGTANLDDFEFVPDIVNFYRVTQVALEDAVDVFTSSGTWNKPVGLTAAKITVIGSGGGGGGAGATGVGETAVGSGGGAGVTAISVIDAASLGASETVTIAPGGAGGVGTGAAGAGGTSSFGTHMTAGGGGAGSSAVSTASASSGRGFGGNGGSSGTGQLVINGGAGECSLRLPPTTSIPNGGDSVLGTGGRGGANTTGLDGVFGGGGGGTGNLANQIARNGGAGGNGLVLVEHIFAD